MVPTSGPRSQPNQTHLTGWVWPHLVDVSMQKGNVNRSKCTTAAPALVSAAPSLPNLKESRDVFVLKEEQVAPPSSTQNLGRPGEGNMSDQHAETSKNTNVEDEEFQRVNIAPQSVPLPEEPAQQPETQALKHGEQTIDNGILSHTLMDNTKNADFRDDNPSRLSTEISPAVDVQVDPFPSLKQGGFLDSQFSGLAHVALLPAEAELYKFHKPLPPPTIMIQRPSNSDISESDGDESPVAPLPTPKPCSTDNVVSGGRPRTRSPPLGEQLDNEECHATSKSTEQDRERMIQSIASDITAIPPGRMETEDLSRTINVKVKRRMKLRSTCVRGPVLKLLLGRQLAGPTKEALRMYALGKAVPVESLPIAAAGVSPYP